MLDTRLSAEYSIGFYRLGIVTNWILNVFVVQATVDEEEEVPEKKPKAKGGFLSMLGISQETIYADED